MISGNLKTNIFWPIINDEASAREAAKQGWYAALFSGGATLIAIISKSTPYSSLFDVFIICLIGFGCLKMSRTAAIFGLAYTIFNAGYKYAVHSTFGIMPLFIIFFITATRGSFKFHNMKKEILSGR